MYHQRNANKDAHESQQKIDLEAIGNDLKAYQEKITWLKNKWDNQKDSTPARIICPLLKAAFSPLAQALIMDNLDYFQKHYNKKEGNPNNLLALSSLCGSKEVSQFLLKDQNKNYLSPECDFILSYVAAISEYGMGAGDSTHNGDRRAKDTSECFRFYG